MDIDPDISNWVLEFLLAQPLDDGTLDSLFRTLPLPKNNLHLQKSILLKKLDSEVSRNSISDSTLELLEQLEELEFQRGIETVSDNMKHAYCAVAVECTVKHLAVNGDVENSDKFNFFERLDGLWRGRIERMERVLGKGGLGSEELYGWKVDFEAAVWDDSVCERIVKKAVAINAAEALSIYVREEREKMGPSFLELVAERIKDDTVMLEMLGVGSAERVAEKEASPCHVDQDAKSDDDEGDKEIVQLKDKIICRKRSRVMWSGTPVEARIADPDEVPVGHSHRNYDVPGSAEVNKVREALESSSLELQAVVKDPLPDALRLAEAISDTNVFTVDSTGVVQDAQCNVGDDMPRLNLMERKTSAHVYEWDESPDNSGNHGFELRLPTPRILNVSPLVQYKPKNLKARRKRKLWSTLEEDTLRNGVQIYGIGNWKDILSAYRDIFEDRTEVDLKDKWRNLARH